MTKILCVDDSSIMRKIIRGAVDMVGFEFLEAEHGEAALAILEKNWSEISLILLDWNMPVMDGFETLQKLKQTDRYASIPVMMVTTEGERANVIRAIQAGAKHYLTKPFSQEDLMVKMMECLGMS